jgi:hypothetical protein
VEALSLGDSAWDIEMSEEGAVSDFLLIAFSGLR